MAFTRINDRVLHWRLAGRSDRPVVAFSNSLGSDFRIWDEVVATLADRWQILLYDKIGHGLSDLPGGAYAIDDHTDDLIGLLDHIGTRRAAIVGLSVGGMIAQRLAVRQPERVSALFLCDTAAKIGTTETWAARIAAVESGGIASIADVVLERWFTKAFRQIWPNELRGWRNMLVRSPVEGYVATCAAIRDTDLTSEAAKIRLPTLCVVGDEDGSTPPDVVEATAKLIPSAKFEIIEGAGHLPCIEKPAVLAELIERHLAEAGHG